MIIWREHKYTQKEITQARNWWRSKTNSATHGVAITSAKKIASLASYSQKDKKDGVEYSYISNLSKEQLKKIPKWESKSAVKIKNIEKLEKELKNLGNSLSKYEYCYELNKIYNNIYGRPLMHRNTYIKYLYKAGYISNQGVVFHVFNHKDNDDIIPGLTHIQDTAIMKTKYVQANAYNPSMIPVGYLEEYK